MGGLRGFEEESLPLLFRQLGFLRVDDTVSLPSAALRKTFLDADGVRKLSLESARTLFEGSSKDIMAVVMNMPGLDNNPDLYELAVGAPRTPLRITDDAMRFMLDNGLVSLASKRPPSHTAALRSSRAMPPSHPAAANRQVCQRAVASSAEAAGGAGSEANADFGYMPIPLEQHHDGTARLLVHPTAAAAAAHEERIRVFEERIKALQEELDTKDSIIRAHQAEGQRHSELERQNEELRELIKLRGAEVLELQAKWRELKGGVEPLHQSVEKAQREALEARLNLKRMEESCARLMAQLKEADEEKTSLQVQMKAQVAASEAAKAEVFAVARKIEEQRAAYETTVAEMLERVVKSEARVLEMTRCKDAVEALLTDSRDEVKVLKSQVQGAMQAVEMEREAKEKALLAVAEVTKQKKARDDECLRLREAVDVKTRDIEFLEDDLTRVRNQNLALNGKKRQLEIAQQERDSTCDKLEAEVEDLRSRLASMEEQYETMSAEYNTAQAAMSQLRNQLLEGAEFVMVETDGAAEAQDM